MNGVKTVLILESDTLDVYQNQATELALFRAVTQDEVALFLWTNDRTVVIGRNQDALAECRVEQLEADGGHLARRLSGGGAVYHDKGNLNFTFFARKRNFDKEKNFEVIFEAMRACGFDVKLTGRNDVTINGKKFSGNAYYNDGDRHYHHGTILIDTDAVALEKYLTPSKEKLKSKGVASVRSRVVNLGDLNHNFNKDAAIIALKSAIKNAYINAKVIERKISCLSQKDLDDNLLYFSNRDWILGRQVCYNLRCYVRLSFGSCEVRCKVTRGKILDACIITDSLELDSVLSTEKLLIGRSLQSDFEGDVNDNDDTTKIMRALSESIAKADITVIE